MLVDSEPIAVRIDLQMLAAAGWEMDEAEVVERYVGRSAGLVLREIEERRGAPMPPGWEEPFRRLRWEAFARELTPIDGVTEALDAIALPTCVASGSSHESLRYKLELTGLYERFRGRIFSATEVANGKPAPDLFLYAAERMGFAPRDCVVVEDSRYGVEAARAAGMRALAYADGFVPRIALKGPDTIVFDDMRELPGLLSTLAVGGTD